MPLFSREPSTRSILVRALVLGVSAGLRSVTPLGMLARHQPEARASAGWANWPLLRSNGGRTFIQVSWIGEIIADKMPFMPSRLNPGLLAGRIGLGMIAGLAIGTERPGVAPKVGGALLGAAGAVAGSYGGYYARTSIVEATGLPDTAVALVEDVAAASIAQTAVEA